METTTAPIHPWVAEGARRVRFGLNAMAPPDWSAMRDFAQTAEGLGFDALLSPDHPMGGGGTWPVLAALAEATRTIRLGTLVSCVHYWHPVVLARSVADVDRISGGRVVLGLGSGDMPHEYRQMGLAFPPVGARQAALEEGLRIIGPLLRGEEVTFQGEHFRAEGARLRTPPVQQPHVPILVAGGGERTTLRFAAQYADASNMGAASWAGGAFTAEDARHKFAVLRGHCEAAGRPSAAVLRTALAALFLADTPAALAARRAQAPPAGAFFERLPIVGTPEEAAIKVRGLVEAGFRYVIFAIRPNDPETLRLAAERLIPAVLSG